MAVSLHGERPTRRSIEAVCPEWKESVTAPALPGLLVYAPIAPRPL